MGEPLEQKLMNQHIDRYMDWTPCLFTTNTSASRSVLEEQTRTSKLHYMKCRTRSQKLYHQRLTKYHSDKFENDSEFIMKQLAIRFEKLSLYSSIDQNSNNHYSCDNNSDSNPDKKRKRNSEYDYVELSERNNKKTCLPQFMNQNKPNRYKCDSNKHGKSCNLYFKKHELKNKHFNNVIRPKEHKSIKRNTILKHYTRKINNGPQISPLASAEVKYIRSNDGFFSRKPYIVKSFQ